MQRTKSKILSILLSLVMLLSLLPTTALAAGNYPNSVRVYNGNGTFTSLSDGQCLATNAATSAIPYTSGDTYVARYDQSNGTLYLNGYQNDHQIIAPSSVIFADGDLNIEVVSDSGFSTSVSATSDLYGIQANGKLNISGPGKLTVTANGDGDVYGIYAGKGVTIAAPLEVNVGKAEEDSSKNGPVCGIYAQSGTIYLSGNDMTITATGGNEAAYGVYNQAQTSSSAAGSSNITITGKLTVNLNKGSSNVGIYTGSGGTITLDGATVIIPKNFDPGIFNNNGNVIIKNNSNVTLTSDVSGSWGVYAKYGGDLIIENSTVKVSADSLAACLERGNVSIKDSKVELTSTYNHYEVIKTGNSSLKNTIDLSGSGSGPVTLTASGKQEGSMIGGKVTATPGTKCVKGTYYDYENYDGEYDTASNTTVLKFVHDAPASTANISLDKTGTMDFGSVKAGYTTAPAAQTVTITNSGTADTGALTIALESTHATSFTLSKTSITNIAAGNSDTFTVQPNTGLTAGTYNATVKVSGAGVTEQSFDVKFTVKDPNASASVSGKVTSYGSDSDDVTVQLIEAGHTEPAYEAIVTGNSATYSFPTVPAGTYTLKVMKKGHAPWTESITVDSAAIAKDVTVYLYGDVNYDGAVKTIDITMARQYFKGNLTLTDEQIAVMDMNGDGAIKVIDITILRQYFKGNISEIPIT